ncbi:MULTISPECIES: threonine/serine exporter ThrE family protein [unclassified Fusibacter]|uniref:threonine/serine ThrE exporter family protein n=1 Tax=unclassified Fusibacter TaxID=2624464 RepID=UPI0013E967CF|nr:MULTISPECIES: threonine/serine exporter family protein [unclassified Fusibacter]MCK8061442.1 threonine/serine exporter family protein [Fusibacter sp. A2]NPE23629.1 threonine/serine exporter family protein [Fusibacter sp. A1]
MPDTLKAKLIMNTALLAGKTMLENGAETYRVEETVEKMCSSQSFTDTHCFCVPTGIFFSGTYQDEEYTFIRRVKTTRIDLEVIAMVNQFSRNFTSGLMTLEEAQERLKNIASTPKFPMYVRMIFSGVAAGFFAMIFGGSFNEFVGAFLTGFLAIGIIDISNFRIQSYFIKHMLAGFSIGIIAITCAYLMQWGHLSLDEDIVIIGGLMPFVPGVAMTNALRDTISGDFISGVSKLSEAIIIAVAIAIGVGIALNLVTI